MRAPIPEGQRLVRRKQASTTLIERRCDSLEAHANGGFTVGKSAGHASGNPTVPTGGRSRSSLLEPIRRAHDLIAGSSLHEPTRRARRAIYFAVTLSAAYVAFGRLRITPPIPKTSIPRHYAVAEMDPHPLPMASYPRDHHPERQRSYHSRQSSVGSSPACGRTSASAPSRNWTNSSRSTVSMG